MATEAAKRAGRMMFWKAQNPAYTARNLGHCHVRIYMREFCKASGELLFHKTDLEKRIIDLKVAFSDVKVALSCIEKVAVYAHEQEPTARNLHHHAM